MKGERWMDAINFHVIAYLFTRQEQTKNKEYAPDQTYQPNMKSRISMCTLTQWESKKKRKMHEKATWEILIQQ